MDITVDLDGIKKLMDHLNGDITIKRLSDEDGSMQIIVAVGKDGRAVVINELNKFDTTMKNILSYNPNDKPEVKKKKPGRKPGATMKLGRPTKDLNSPSINKYSPDFLKNDSVKMEDDKIIDKELEEIERSRQRDLRKFDKEDKT